MRREGFYIGEAMERDGTGSSCVLWCQNSCGCATICEGIGWSTGSMRALPMSLLAVRTVTSGERWLIVAQWADADEVWSATDHSNYIPIHTQSTPNLPHVTSDQVAHTTWDPTPMDWFTWHMNNKQPQRRECPYVESSPSIQSSSGTFRPFVKMISYVEG